MKFCPYCGHSLESEFDYCPNCGKKLVDDGTSSSENTNSETINVNVTSPILDRAKDNDTAYQVAYVFMVISTIFMAFAIIPMAWCIPMTLHYKHAHERGEEVTIAFKVCSLLFVSMIGGIAMFLDHDL